MEKNIKIFAFVLIIILSIVVIVNVNKDKNLDKENNLNSYYNEQEEKYYIYDSNGELIKTTTDQAELEFYEENPDYNPGLLNIAEPGIIENTI